MSMQDELQAVEFSLGTDVFAVPVTSVREILDYVPPSPVPNGPDYFLGLTDVRGLGVATLDLRRRLGLPPHQPTLATRILILELQLATRQLTLGVVVDRVLNVSTFETRSIEGSPDIGVRWNSAYLQGVIRRDTGFVLLLDIAEILTSTEAEVFGLTAEHAPKS